jgi:hypothetical protein
VAQEESQKFTKAEVAKFLDTEYSECFDQIRHYESIADSYLKYATAGYPVIVGGISALYTILDVDYRNIVVSALLLLTFFAGTAVLALLLTNRSYYVVVARQINAIRHYFLRNTNELDFIKYNRAYLDSDKPCAYNPNSTSTRLFDIVSILNSLAGSGCIYFLLYQLKVNNNVIWIVSAIFLVLLFFTQRVWGIRYLKKKDKEHIAQSK